MGRKLQYPGEINSLAVAIDVARRSRHMTLEDVANRTGVDRSQVSRFTHGRFKTASQNLQKVCKFLQVDVSAFSDAESALPSHLLGSLERSWICSGKRQKALETALLAVASAFIDSAS